MPCDIATVKAEACASGIAFLSPTELLVVMAQSLATADAETLLEEACASGISKLSEQQLLVIIAQSLCAV